MRFEDPLLWPTVLRTEPYTFVEQARVCAGLGPHHGTWRHIDRNNEAAVLGVDAMSNSYTTFVLIWLPRREVLKRRRTLALAA